jgi:hypothetical protein
MGGRTIPTGVGTAGSSDTSFESDEGIKVTGRTAIIDHIIGLCGFAEDSIMVEYIDQEEWSKIHHVTSIGIYEVKDFHTIKDNGSYEAKPLTMHLRLLKRFLLYYRRRCNNFSMTLDEHDVMTLITKKPFENYMSLAEFFEDLAACESPIKPPPPTVSNMVTATEGLKDDKFFNTWNRGFIATACMHQTDLVLMKSTFRRAILKMHYSRKCRHLCMQYWKNI